MNETVSPFAQRRDRTATSKQKGMQVNDRPRSVQAPSRRFGFVAAATLAALLCMVFVSSASAAQVRPFKEVFGSAAQPSFGGAEGLSVDQSSGDVLVIDAQAQTVSRYHADGTPSDFSTLGTNVIDAKEGSGGKPCAEEPESCDQTPQNGFSFGGPNEVQIAVDNSGGATDGNIYVTQSLGYHLIDIFGADGSYLGQLTAAGEETFGESCGVAVDEAGTVYVGDYTNGSIFKFVPSGSVPVNADNTATFDFPGQPCTLAAGAGPTAGSIFPAQYGGSIYKMNASTGAVEYQLSSTSTTTETVDPTTGHLLVASADGAVEFDVSGPEPVVVGKLATSDPVRGIGIDGSSDQAYVSRPTQLEVFGPGVSLPSATATAASEVTGTKARLNGVVNPEGVEVEECFFEWGETTAYGNVAPCEGAIPTDSEDHAVHADISGLEANGAIYHYRLVATNENGTEQSGDKTLVTGATVITEAATNVNFDVATLNGTVRPEGQQYTGCSFEYGLNTSAGYEDSIPCEPSGASIPADFAGHAVSADLTGLERGEVYKFRLTATNSAGTVVGARLTFETQGPPRILLTRASDADQSSATLEARINPNGFATSYKFEWGATAAYGNSAPASFEPIGSGTTPVTVSAEISGLSAATVYHYRVVAESEGGAAEGIDHKVETLNSCGLPDGRCFELVSRRDAGPVALIEPEGGSELAYQAAAQPGSLAYNVETGYLDATKGANILYRGTRGSSEWATKQLSAPIIAHDETKESSSGTSKTLAVSDDLSCNIQESSQPLTDEPSTRLVIEAGGANLYRQNPDGSYTAITRLAPENPEDAAGFIGAEYTLLGFTQDCGKVLFSVPYRYAGVPTGESAGGERIYEWDEGTLRGIGFIPGPGGETPSEVALGAGANSTNVLSEDGSRIFLSAYRLTSPNPEEMYNTAIFVRENGTVRDLSLSETSTPSGNATYQWASEDGSRVFFTARAGLTEESSPEGTDLYEYNLETEDLTDLTATDEEGGAEVGGFIGGSDDGTHVYFIARGQLVPGRGKSFAENQADKTYSVYGVEDGEFEYAGLVRESYPRISNQDVHYDENQLQPVIIEDPEFQTARVSSDGRYLLFESSADVTGYDSGNGITEAYLFDSEADAEPTVCISCRPDGAASHSPINNTRLPVGGFSVPLHQPRSLVVRNGQAQVYFNAFDRLAPGGVDELSNVYEWSHGQVFHIDTEPPGLQEYPGEDNTVDSLNSRFMDASEDGTDLYLGTPNRLTWEDGDDRTSAFSARVGGGFPEPPAPPAPCNPTGEGSCQGAPGLVPATPAPGSATFTGPANPKPKKVHRKKHHKKKHKKKKHHKKNKKNKKKNNANRRAGK